jgi:hypothetical protein
MSALPSKFGHGLGYERNNTLTGAGATMSLGKKARELTNTSVNRNMAKIISGAMY